jgi:hypothetical protein
LTDPFDTDLLVFKEADMRVAVVGALLLPFGILAGCTIADLYLGPYCGDSGHAEPIDPTTGKPDPCYNRGLDAGTDGQVDGGEVNVPSADCPEERECVPHSPHGWSSRPYLMWVDGAQGASSCGVPGTGVRERLPRVRRPLGFKRGLRVVHL